MKFKSILLLFAAALSISAVFGRPAPGTVTITGTIIHINNKMQVSDVSEMKSLRLPNDERTFIPDSTGHFTVSFKLDKPNYFKIGRNVLYLSPGDDLKVALDYNDPNKAIITGPGAEANNYLRATPFPHGGSFLEAGKNIRKNIKQTIDTILVIGHARELDLALIKNVSAKFREYEQARIKADILNSLTNMNFYYPYVRKIPKDSVPAFEQEFKKQIAPYQAQYSKGFISPDYLKLEVYAGIAGDILNKDDQSPAAKQVRDWLNAEEVAYKIQHLGSKDEIIAMKPQVDAIADQQYRTVVADTYKNLVKFGNGDKAIDFTMMTADNKKLKLSDYAGKIIFVDIWATWCGPCIAELPYMEKLKEKYKGNPDVVFISLSIDDNRPAWKKMLQGMKADGIQSIADRSSLNDYSVIDIPRTIVINKDFKITAMKGNLPSAKQTGVLLDGLLAGTVK
ncbi:MAG: TlpA disulfide reductase family protein [Bacteroidota bacterium]